MGNVKRASMNTWICDPLSTEVKGALDRLARTDGVAQIAVMPDVHLAKGVCIGTVLAGENRIFPEAVGNDIGCGMAAMGFEAEANCFNDHALAEKVLRGLARVVPALKHPLGRAIDWLPSSLADVHLSNKRLISALRREGSVQFGTLGRGNHFLELQTDENGRLWIMVHSGSRGMGQLIAQFHIEKAERSNTAVVYFDADSERGRNYLNDAAWAVEYARENRRRMIESTAMLLEELAGIRADLDTYFDSVHNFVRQETLNGSRVFVHRKGANSADADELALVPGSMGTASYHVLGRGNLNALNSCSHGAGRAMSRSKARATISEKKLKHDMRGICFDASKSRSLLDEAPIAYKNIETVMRAQRDLVTRIRRLRPVLSYKGGH